MKSVKDKIPFGVILMTRALRLLLACALIALILSLVHWSMNIFLIGLGLTIIYIISIKIRRNIFGYELARDGPLRKVTNKEK